MKGFLLLAAAALTACGPRPPVLLFTGAGTSPNDVAAIESVLDSRGLSYSTASSCQLNAMPAPQLSQYRLLIVPGGNFVDMGKSLTPATAAKVRTAVNGGMNYLGICAGGFLAGSFPEPYRSFNLSGAQFGFYGAENQGTHKAAVKLAFADGRALDHYWEDGPQFTGWGQVVAKYPDGTPAIVEGNVGQGLAILSGVHPEAPERWRRGLAFATPASEDTAFAGKLIGAALNRTPLPHY